MPDKRFQAWRKSTIRGRCPLINPQKRKTWRQKRKIKNNPEEKASVSSLLNVSITPSSSPLNGSIRGPWCLKQKKEKQKLGFPIKDFGNDGWGRSSPLSASTITLSVIPEWFYQESKLFKDKNLWIPTSSSPRQFLSRGPQYLKKLDAW